MSKWLYYFLVVLAAVLCLSCSGGVTKEPGITPAVVTDEPEVTAHPADSEEPAITDKPTDSGEPAITDKPADSEEPAITDRPTVPDGSDSGSELTAVRIAVIDSGLSSEVLNFGHILTGCNYVFSEQNTEDRIGHGTACAAFIVGSEAARIEGYCPGAMLVPLVYADVFCSAESVKEDIQAPGDTDYPAEESVNESGEQVVGDIGLVAQAVRDAVDVYGCDIILISSGSTKDDEVLHEAVVYAHEHGKLIVSCAGNSGNTDPEAVYYPGAYPEVLCVGSLNSKGEKASFSTDNEYIDIWETGADLRLATLKGTRIRGQGTSYSAAIAAGRIAQYMMDNPGAGAGEAVNSLYRIN